MNYSELSDDKINLHVFERLFGNIGEDGDMLRVWQQGKFQPCNSWADAGPIIEKNRISIEFDGDDAAQWCHTISCEGLYGIEYQSNPLRAAMITFLLMQEAANA